MSTISPAREAASDAAVNDVIISADSHVLEPYDLWAKEVPWAVEHMSHLPARSEGHKPGGPDVWKLYKAGRAGEPRDANTPMGGQDPSTRLLEMAVDGVSAEVLYTTLGLRLYSMDHAEAQEACFRVFNDYLIDYCKPNLDRLLGVACISVYNIDRAVKELERCHKAGLRGALIWQAPHPDLPFHSDHYNPFWEAAEALGVPVSVHSLTGHNYTKNPTSSTGEGVQRYKNSVNNKLWETSDALVDLIFTGVLERYPGLKFVLVEDEIGWLPFYLQQWDRLYRRDSGKNAAIPEKPSFYWQRQIFSTFFEDPIGCHLLGVWGQDNCMWSSDYPHANSLWPRSREYIANDLGHLGPEAKQKILRDNVARLYGMTIPTPIPEPAS